MSNRPGGVNPITRAAILGGRNVITHVEIPGIEGRVPIRRLTGRQRAQIEGIKTRGVRVVVKDPSRLDTSLKVDPDAMDVQIDLEASAIAKQEADSLTVHYGLAFDEPVSLDEVDEMDPVVVRAIAAEIYRLSGVDEGAKREIARFRGQ